MSAKQEKRHRQAMRYLTGISKQAEREQLEFAAECARVRMAKQADAELPIVRLDGKRKALALIVLALFAYVIASCVVAAIGARWGIS